MEQKQDAARFHIGMRNVKTALAVFIILFIYRLLDRNDVTLALVAAIICMRDSIEQSVITGVARMLGTSLGALIGIGFLALNLSLPVDMTLLFAPVAIIATIWLFNVIRHPDSIVIGCVVLLVILLQHTSQNPLLYSLNRLFDTLFGVVIAVLINRFVNIPTKKSPKRKERSNMHADMLDTIGFITKHDKEVGDAIALELGRQRRNLELIASENIVTPAVMAAAGTVLTNKYAEGYPGKRYYGGCQCVDIVENIAIERAKKIFGAGYVNVQPHSGAQANEAAYAALIHPGDTVLGMNLSQGGHLTHGSPVNFSGKLYNFVAYGVDPVSHRIDYDEVRKLALAHQPKLIVAGASAYPRMIDFEKFSSIAKEVGAYFMVDMAHIAGLVAAGLHPSPVPFADITTTTTHKTLRGIRGGLILSNDEEIAKAVNKAVFPGTQGGPLMHIIAAKAVGFGEVLSGDFKAYTQQVLDNCKALADGLLAEGFELVSGGTDNHLMLVDLTNMNITGKDFEHWLDEVYITVNKNTIPNETRSPFVTSGVRVGTAAVTTRGLVPADMKIIAQCFKKVAVDFEGSSDAVRKTVTGLLETYPLYE